MDKPKPAIDLLLPRNLECERTAVAIVFHKDSAIVVVLNALRLVGFPTGSRSPA